MSTTIKYSFGIALSLLTASAVTAAEPLARPNFPSNSPGYGYGYNFGAASTAHESINRGRATLLRSHGETQLLLQEARRSQQEANSRLIDNRIKLQQARLQLRRMGEAEQAAKYAKIDARRQTAMALNNAEQILNANGSPSAIAESRAEAKLRLAKNLLENGREEQAVSWLKTINEEFAGTAAAGEAKQLLAGINS